MTKLKVEKSNLQSALQECQLRHVIGVCVCVCVCDVCVNGGPYNHVCLILFCLCEPDTNKCDSSKCPASIIN